MAAGPTVGDRRTDRRTRRPCAYAKATHRWINDGCGGEKGIGIPFRSRHLPPKEVLKHLQVCQEGTHLMLERSPPP
jgi:hypothetical protein